MNFVNGKIRGIPYLTSPEEKANFYKMLSYALMSQGPMSHVVYLGVQGGRIRLANNLHTLGIKLMGIHSKTVTIVDCNRAYTFNSAVLWKVFLSKIVDLFPNAQAEALSKSKEIPKRDIRSAGFDFSAEDKESP
jgi:hypothetical protein